MHEGKRSDPMLFQSSLEHSRVPQRLIRSHDIHDLGIANPVIQSRIVLMLEIGVTSILQQDPDMLVVASCTGALKWMNNITCIL